ncbi:hypothetical protein DRQ07_06340 [candidate division KSB1 bacterium]|nr:MAG: hypothetical protein DRQ07_06340 [candidate division KSB1 bacterium]
MKLKIFISCLFLLLTGGLSYFYFYEKYSKQNLIKNLKNELEEQKNLNKIYILRDKRRKCISKTLKIAYNLSDWESHCYSIFFDDFSIYYKINWEIYAALIRVESNFNPTVKSGANCKGLMQIKESTGKEIAEKLGISFIENQSLWNDFINIILGAEYLSGFIQEKGFDGGVKSYLGGPDYLKSIKKRTETYTYVKEYKIRVSDEYNQLQYIFRGVADEYNITFEELKNSVFKDSISPIFNIFKNKTNSEE